MVTAKFYVEEVSERVNSPGGAVEGKNVKLRAVIADRPENKSWSKWTPWGSLEMGITNPDAFEQFKVGAEVLITLEIQPVEAK